MRKLFGTDGVRGTANIHPMTAEMALRIGAAVGRYFRREAGGVHRVVIGKDTRLSGYMFENALTAGLTSTGMNVLLLGPVPTPAVGLMTRSMRADLGVMISASHNPAEDNGIKFFSAEGTKLPDDIEFAIEEEIEKPMDTVASDSLGKARRVEDAGGRYVEFCKSTVPGLHLKGMKVVLDCAHGATYDVGPKVFSELGAEVIVMGNRPDGLNINNEVGSTHPKQLQALVLEQKADLGIAFDGDGDRVMMVDAEGELLDGDELLYIIARHRQENQQLGGGVVGTLMTNLGLEKALEKLDIPLIRAKVGDRYVMEQMSVNDWHLGGENSGHIVCNHVTTTGDGIVSALQVLCALAKTGQTLNQAKSGMRKYPQEMINVRLSKKQDVMAIPAVQTAVAATEEKLADRGRVLLRPSGTEPVVRVMIEGEDASEVRDLCSELAGEVEALID